MLRLLTLLVVCSLGASAYAQAEACVSAHANAQRARRKGQFLEAQRQLLLCAQVECPRVVRNDCVTWADEVEASTPSLVLAVKGSHGEDLASVRVLANEALIAEGLDGRAIQVDPGVYKLRFEADGYVPREETISVREGEKTRLVRVQLESAPTAAPQIEEAPPRLVWSPAAITLGSMAIASGAAALGFGQWGHQEYDDVRARCGREHSCSEDDVHAGKRAYIAADVLAGVAGASAIAAVWVFLHDNRETRAKLARFDAVPSRDGLRVSFSRAF